MLTEGQPCDTKRFAFQQCLVSESWTTRRHSTQRISPMPTLLKKQGTPPSIEARAVRHVATASKHIEFPLMTTHTHTHAYTHTHTRSTEQYTNKHDTSADTLNECLQQMINLLTRLKGSCK